MVFSNVIISLPLLLLLTTSLLSSTNADNDHSQAHYYASSSSASRSGHHRHRQLLNNVDRPSSFLTRSSSLLLVDTMPSYHVSNTKILEQLRGGGALFLNGGNKNNDNTGDNKALSNQEVATENNYTTSPYRNKTVIIKVGTATISLLLICLYWETITSSLAPLFNREKFRNAIIQTLNNIASRGNTGLLLYTLGFIFWEVCGLPTSIVETAAGMAFGFKKGLLGSFLGKSSGSILAFILGRTLLSNIVGSKMDDMEAFALIERGVARNPLQSAFIIRYSPFPQLVKNFSLSLMKPVTFPMFVLAIVIHGFPFSVLWAALGHDSSLRLRASSEVGGGGSMDANIILNGLLVFVTIFGFVISPVVTGWWLADLRKEKED